MVRPTPEQARDLVNCFGTRRAAARAVGVHQTTISYWLNPDAGRARAKRSQDRRREAIRERKRLWRKNNVELSKERDRQYYESNREAILEKRRRYHEANAEKIRERSRLRRQRLKDAGLCVTCTQPSLSENYCLDCLTKRTVYG